MSSAKMAAILSRGRWVNVYSVDSAILVEWSWLYLVKNNASHESEMKNMLDTLIHWPLGNLNEILYM